MERMTVFVVITVMLMAMVGETEPAPNRFSKLLKEESIRKQLELIQKLVDVLLDMTECPANISIVKVEPEDCDQKGKTTVAPGEVGAEETTKAPGEETVTELPEGSEEKPEPEEGKVTQKPEEGEVTQKPEEEEVTRKPEEEDVTQTPEEEDVTQKPEEEEVTQAPEEEDVTQTPEEEETTPTPTSSPQPEEPTTPSYDCYTNKAMDQPHTMDLEPNPACKYFNHGLQDVEEEKKIILELHNEYRAKVARGDVDRGSPGPMPPAANMRELVWNDELAVVAQAWAKQCPVGHEDLHSRSICSRNYFVGQNINYYMGSREKADWKKAIDDWYKEVDDVPKDLIKSFKKLNTQVKIGHYIQMMWATTREIGCGVVYYEETYEGTLYPQSKTYVCNYGPSGNVLDRPVYIEGSTASQCPEGISQTYPDLCA